MVRIGDKVYLLYKDKAVIIDQVKFIGEDSFIIDRSFAPEYEFESYEWFYKDKDIKWSKNLDLMLEKLESKNPGKEIEYIEDVEEYSIK